MNIAALKSLLEVAETENISRAALNRNITQSSITKHLQSLEKEYGQKLYKRRSKGIELTRAGAVLSDRAEHIIEYYEDTRLAMSKETDRLSGKLVLACDNDIWRGKMLDIIMGFHDEYPDVRICFRSGDKENLEYLLKHNLADASQRLMFQGTGDKNPHIYWPETQ